MHRNLLFFRKVSLLKGLHCQLKGLCLDEYFVLFCCDNSYQHRDCIQLHICLYPSELLENLGNCYGISVSQMTNDIYRYSSSQSVIYSFLTYCRICSKNIVHCSLRFLHKTRCSVSHYLLLCIW
jgi:hypothetical protein